MKLIQRSFIFCDITDTIREDFGSWSVTLPRLEKKPHTVYRLHTQKLILPYNWKKVTSTTKTITYIHQNGTTFTWTLTEGNPALPDLLAELTALFGNNLAWEFDRIQSRFVFSNPSSTQTFTLATTAYEVFGFVDSNPVTVPISGSYTSPNPIDLRPYPIVELRTDITTASQEVVTGGRIANSQILCAIGMDVIPFSHKVWYDTSGEFFCDVTDESRELRFFLTTPQGTRIIPQSAPYIVYAIDELRDDEGQLLDTQVEALRLQKYQLLLQQPQK